MERKGQHLFNEISKKHELLSHQCTMNGSDMFPYYNLHQILFYMTDKEFDKMMSTLPNSKSVVGKI